MDLALGVAPSEALALARSRFARALFPEGRGEPDCADPLSLRPHQLDASRIVAALLRRFGGAVLADPVGTGKTRIALEVARHHTAVTVVCPAVLRSMWSQSLKDAHLSASLLSMESLSRATPATAPGGLVIVDEAHHFRNPGTQRRAALETLAWGQDILLLTATPVHNHDRDLASLCALFLGARSLGLPVAALHQLVCRRSEEELALPLPAVAPPVWIACPAAARVLEQIVALPPPLPPSDGGTAAALGTLVLVRQYCSSLAALRAALHRRLHLAITMETRLRAGVYPSRHEVRRWLLGSASVQLQLGLDSTTDSCEGLLEYLRDHTDGVRALRALLDECDDHDRFDQVNRIIATHRDERVVLFTHSADTAHALFAALKTRWRCALLTGSHGLVASGHLPRNEILARFVPSARLPDDLLRMDVLIATDVVSEGVNLHAASVLVHLDLPWTVARIEQRIGRLRRLGAPRSEVRQYALQPPHASEKLTGVLRRLARKAGLSRRAVGVDPVGFALPASFRRGISRTRGTTSSLQRLRSLLKEWAADDPSLGASPVVVLAESDVCRGWVAAVQSDCEVFLVANEAHGVTREPSTILRLLANAGTAAACDHPEARQAAWSQLDRWLRDKVLRESLLLDRLSVDHQQVLRRLSAFATGASRIDRYLRLALTARARELVLQSAGSGAERALRAWLAQMATGPLTAAGLEELIVTLAPRVRAQQPRVVPTVEALLIIVPA